MEKSMLYVIFIFMIPNDAPAVERQNDLLKYLRMYEIAECKILRHRKKRNFDFQDASHKTSAQDADAEIQLKTPNKLFHLVLNEDGSFCDISIQTQMPMQNPTTKHSPCLTKFYEGALKNKTIHSSAIGYVINNTFSGYVMEDNVLYLVEPMNLLLSNSTIPPNVIIYKFEDINWGPTSDYPLNPLKWRLLYRTANIPGNVTLAPVGIDLDTQENDLFCNIEVVADHELYNYFQRNVEDLSAYLYFHVKYADKIFRQTDFTMNGKPDSIRLSVAKISIYASPSDSNYPMAISSEINDYLMKFVHRQQDLEFCLSLSMSYRSFHQTAIGEAFRPDVNFPHYFGGICEQPLPSPKGTSKLYFNTGAVNLRNKNVGLLPLAITLLAFTHEIGHGFGSGHDLHTHRLCSPGKTMGKYLMHPKVLSRSEQRMEFSPCSRLIMREVIQRKGNCLKSNNATCGNGIREGEEECDCGSETICHSIDSCCSPANAWPPEVGCTIKKLAGFECSPKESACCNENCTVSQNTNLQCYSDFYLCLQSYCDGLNPHCPNPKETSCASSRLKKISCNEENCSTSICGYKGLPECTCWHDLTKECLVCCEKENRCVPASDLGILNPMNDDYVLPEGTSCNDGSFRCDSSGNCVNSEGNIYGISPLYVSLIVVSVFATLCLSLVVYFSRKKVNLENLLLLRNHI